MEYRKTTDLKEYPGNPRKISPEKLNSLMESIKRNPDYFEAKPIILSDRTGELIIIAGNMRYKAACALKLETVPTVLIKGIGEEREKEIILLDNFHHGEWVPELLDGFDFEFIDFEPPITYEKIETFQGSTEQFKKEFDNIKDKDASNPIVPEFMENYNAVIIIITNEIDELYVRNVLKLNTKMGNINGKVDRVPNVITVDQLKGAIL